MRAYFFGNMYLSSIQQGIQALHCLGEMHNKYSPNLGANDVGIEVCMQPSTQLCQLRTWEEEHKTVVLLSAGFSEEIRDLHTFFFDNAGADGDNYFPFAAFHEGEDALDGALTCTGIVLPQHIYDGAKEANRVMRLRPDIESRMLFENDRILNIEIAGEMREVEYNEFEVALMQRMSQYRLAQ